MSVNINFKKANNKKYGKEEQNKQEIGYTIPSNNDLYTYIGKNNFSIHCSKFFLQQIK
jgi:hypothetical protein